MRRGTSRRISWWVAAVTYGEGWHNNHHAFQTSARHGLRWWEVDMTYMAIRFLSYFGITYAIKLPKVPKRTVAQPSSLDTQVSSDPDLPTVSGTVSDEPELAVASN